MTKKHEPVIIEGNIPTQFTKFTGHPLVLKVRRKMNLKKGEFTAEHGPQKGPEIPGIPKTRLLG